MSSVEAVQSTTTKPAQNNSNALLLQRKCACGGSAGLSGECTDCQSKKLLGKTLQTKLCVNEPGDMYEQEADRVADQVMSTPAHPAVSGAPPRIQRFSGQANGQTDAAPPSVGQTLASSGRPLEPALRQEMEQRFGHDFSRVRVHSDATAERSAQDVNAHAYTVGHHIVFGSGSFAPGTHDGRRLIAHELTHVVQQNGSSTLGSATPISATSAEARVMREPIEASPMTPAELVKYILDQRGFHSTAPRVTVNAQGAQVVKRGSVIPTIDPRGIGTPLGLGFETHAIVQVFDVKGNLVATELGVFSGSYQTHAAIRLHAEAQGVNALRTRLANVDVAGGTMVAAVDQTVCANCTRELHSLAESLRLKGYEVYGPARESLTQPGRSVSPKTAARTAYMGGTRPVVTSELIAGASFLRNRAPLQVPTAAVTPVEPLAPMAPLAKTVSGEITASAKPAVDPLTPPAPPATTAIAQNVSSAGATARVPSVSSATTPTRPPLRARLGRVGAGTLRIGGGVIKGSLATAAVLLPLSFLTAREEREKVQAELRRVEEDELPIKLEEALMSVKDALPRSNLFAHIKIKLEFRREDWGGIAPDIRYFIERASLVSVDAVVGQPGNTPQPECGDREVCYLDVYAPVPLAMADMPRDFEQVLNHVATVLLEVSTGTSVAGARFDDVNKNLYMALKMLGKTWDEDWTTTALMPDAERFTTVKGAVEETLRAATKVFGATPSQDETQLLAKLWTAKYQLDALDASWPMRFAAWDD
jgi:hypothetical protein